MYQCINVLMYNHKRHYTKIFMLKYHYCKSHRDADEYPFERCHFRVLCCCRPYSPKLSAAKGICNTLLQAGLTKIFQSIPTLINSKSLSRALEPGRLEAWKPGSLEAWKPGSLEAWKPGNRIFGRLSWMPVPDVRRKTICYSRQQLDHYSKQIMISSLLKIIS